MALVLICLSGCAGSTSNNETTTTTTTTTTTKSYDSDYNSYDDDDSDYFSNDYGSITTKCAKSGCSNYIASSGDSAYCTAHSNNCLECSCYIDGDAMYCMDCLTEAANDLKKDSYDYDYDYDDYDYNYNYNYYDDYDYDPNDKYYSSNDYNNDGKISDSEFQGALNDYMDDYFSTY